ncbi:transposase [Streptomyces sp. NPDC008222]|uniref:transposase n=1 Tax=Streptomyces sp. NPDC008222 TaxID=3364820 RepID=UPI0036EDDF7D
MGTSKYSPEFRADAVALDHASPGGTYASAAKDVGINHETLRIWVRDAETAARPGAVEATAMEKENRQLRARLCASDLAFRRLGRSATPLVEPRLRHAQGTAGDAVRNVVHGLLVADR